MLKNIAAAGASAAWNIANFVLDGCKLTYVKANLEKVGNVGDGVGPMYASTTGPCSSGRLSSGGVATTQSRCLFNKDADQINDDCRQTDLLTINVPRLSNGKYQKLRPHVSSEKSKSAVASPTTFLMVIAATVTSAPDATSTSPMMSSTSITFSSFILASLIYSTYILD